MLIMHTTHGPIKVKLDLENTPITAENFLNYAKQGFYDGTLFHRVIDGFMIQGGGFLPGMKDKKTAGTIQNEALRAKKNKRGTLAMARTMDPHSATAQFFINVVDNPFLDFKSESTQGWGYCVFGEVVEGIEVIDAIKVVATTSRDGHQDVPVDDILIQRIEVLA